MMKRLLFVIALMLFALPCLAQSTVTFAWDSHPEAATITGFRLYQAKTSMAYSGAPVATFTPGSLTTGTIQKPASFGRYYYVLTAFFNDTSVTPNVITESDYSNEVSLVVKPQKPNLKSAVLSAMTASGRGMVKMAGMFKGKKGLRIVG
jgi:hypothetical protein